MGIHFNHKSKAGDRKMQKELKLKKKAEERRRKRDEKVRLAVKAREPFLLKYPDCPASICMRELARKVLQGAGNAGESKFIDKLTAITEGE